MKTPLSLLFLLVLQFSFAQYETSQWHFGGFSGINFLTNPPLAIPNSSINAQEGCSSIADSAGNLLFYTNGRDVWHKQHALMTGFLPGEQSSAQSALAFRKSGSQYYAFATGAWGTGNFGYGIIDLQQNGGLGAITNTVVLRTQVAERMAGTKHCNGKDTWVLIQPMGTNNFEAYLAGPNAINPVPVISSVGPNLFNSYQAFGTLKFSPLGKKIALCMQNSSNASFDVILYSFNNQNGTVSSPTVLASFSNEICFSTEFSPDETKLYGIITDAVNTNANKHFVQWNLCLASPAAIANSIDTVKVITNLGFTRDLQLAPDGKIYYVMSQFLGTISAPNLSGTACAVSSPTIPISGFGGLCLPNFVSTSFRPKSTFSHTVNCGLASFSPEVLDPCVSAADPILARTWFFGDQSSNTNSTTISNPQHAYSANGSYPVKMVLHYNCHTDTIEKIIQITSLPSLSLTGKASICAGESVTYTLSGANTYTFNNASASTTISLSPPVTTIFAISGSNQNCQASKQFTVTVKACTGVEEKNQNHFIQVYPNPSTGTFLLHSEQDGYYYVYSANGTLLQKGLVTKGQQELNLNECGGGLYFLRVQSVEGNYTLKLMKE